MTVRAGPDVAEARADDAATEQIRAEAHVLLMRDVGEHRGRRMDSHHALLPGTIDVLTSTGPTSREDRDERTGGRVHPGPELRLRQRRADRCATRLARQPEAAAGGGDLEIGG